MKRDFSEEMETFYTLESSATPFQGRRQLGKEKKLKRSRKTHIFYVLSDELTYQKKMGMSQDSLLCSVTSDAKQVPVR